ncbi:hypothetical protein [Streptomyces sp. enrichment culture]|uniref:hypothetical protein n=1 Tax=Streptomyces sp. enrichment culture TaxID=1795815 RepID=UPI003F56C9E8
MIAPTLEDLVTLRRTADEAHAPENQRTAWHTAWKAWGDAVRDVQEAVTEYAFEQGSVSRMVDADVKKAARHPEPAD